MKIAILVSGQPRFTKDLNDLIYNLQEYDQIDWFVYVWKSSNAVDSYVSPSWNNDKSQVYTKLVNMLPPNNFIARLEIVDPPKFDINKSYHIVPGGTVPHVWTMYYGLKMINEEKEKYESQFGKYDLVIRTRADLGITKTIFLNRVKQYLDQLSNKTILIPDNGRLGFVPHGMILNTVNDNFAIGTSEDMSTYCQVFDYIDQYTQEGIPMSAESMLGYHLLKNNILTPTSNFEVTVRKHWISADTLDYGRWT
jgi:hypothetical protein